MRKNAESLEPFDEYFQNKRRRLKSEEQNGKSKKVGNQHSLMKPEASEDEYVPVIESKESWEEMFEADSDSEFENSVSKASNNKSAKKRAGKTNKNDQMKEKKTAEGSNKKIAGSSSSKKKAPQIARKISEEKKSNDVSGEENSDIEEEIEKASLEGGNLPEKKTNSTKEVVCSKNTEELIKNIEELAKDSYVSIKDENGKLRKNVANFGAKICEIATVLRGGEYNGFSVEFLENTRALLTEHRIINALRHLQKEDYQTCIKTLEIQKEYQEFGLKVINYVLRKWLLRNSLNVPDELLVAKEDAASLEDQTIQSSQIMMELNKWIGTSRHDPINARIKVSNIGQSKKGHSVVPEEWLGREFSNAAELHSEMDKLEWRMGKPPVNYCATYGMALIEINKWALLESIGESGFLEKVKRRKPKYVITLAVKGESKLPHLLTTIKEIKSESDARMVWQTRPEFCNFIETSQGNSPVFLLSQNERIFEPTSNFVRTENVGLLVSCLQKAVRRGSKGFRVLHDCILKLRNSPPYNLPDQQFLRVSATRQLFWRLFITVIEDGCLFLQNPEKHDYLSLQDLFCLALTATADPELQINGFILKKVLTTAMHVQAYDTFCWNWRKGPENLKPNDFHLEPISEADSDKVSALKRIKNSMRCAMEVMNMMAGDKVMLTKSIGFINSRAEEDKFCFFSDSDLEKALEKSDEIVCRDIYRASHDIHCFPNITLHLQGTLPFLPKESCSTKNIPKFIWDKSSSFNVRYHKKEVFFKFSNREEELKYLALQSIQSYMAEGKTGYKIDEEIIKTISKNALRSPATNGNVANLTPSINRTAFQSLFGQKVRISPENAREKFIEVIVSGSEGEPCRVKQGQTSDRYAYLQGKERYLGEKRYVSYMNQQKIDVDVPEAPVGFEWVFKNKKKVRIGVELVDDHPVDFRADLLFMVDDYILKPFDASSILKPLQKLVHEPQVPEYLSKLIKECLYYKDQEPSFFKLNVSMRKIAKERSQRGDYHLYQWRNLAEKSPEMNSVVWKHIFVRLYNNFNDHILVGPVDRSGNKLQNSISYLYEGVIWRLYNMLSMIYPRVLQPSGEFKFHLKKAFPEYQDLVDNLLQLCHNLGGIPKQNFSLSDDKVPVIKTSLWEHQASTVERMIEGYIKLGKLGFGDASCVGAGKTLTAISVMQRLLAHNINSKITNFKGFVVLLPTQKLFKTWTDEITKHTSGFIICEQEANGAHKPITQNTILITTLGRMRDHPIYNSWQLVVIDECLSVQNREALQTEEAWRQATISQFGVLMMSATFFRSRFDKMFFMLKMLRSGLPEIKEFLDCILGESMICFIAEKSRKWLTNCHKFALEPDLRKDYVSILERNLSAEKTYTLLNDFLLKNFDLAKHLQLLIKKLETEQKALKALIYARSKDEADYLASELTDVSRYPDKSKRHVVVALSEATYGLNDLVIYNTIVIKPPEPDKLPQIKGRLDRPGQKEDVLRLEYFLIENTIEEALLLRLEVANKFMNDYIMPLAKFYEVAVGKDSEWRF